MTDPRKFANLPADEFSSDGLLALARRLEILVFWREIDRIVYAEVCEFFAKQLIGLGQFLDLARLLLEEANAVEKTETRMLLLAGLLESGPAAQLRLEAVGMPQHSAFQQFSDLADEVDQADWPNLTRGERMALLERLREIRSMSDDD